MHKLDSLKARYLAAVIYKDHLEVLHTRYNMLVWGKGLTAVPEIFESGEETGQRCR